MQYHDYPHADQVAGRYRRFVSRAMRRSPGYLWSAIAALLLVTVAAGCNNENSSASRTPVSAAENRVLATTAWPLHYLTEQIAGSSFTVHCVARDTAASGYWSPSAEGIGQLQSAQLILTNGAGYEEWLQAVTVPVSRIVDTTAKLESELIPLPGEKVHQHGPEGERTRTRYVSRTWLDPQLALRQAEVIRDRLVKQFPEDQSTFADNFEQLRAELVALQQQAARGPATVRETVLIDPELVFPYLVRAVGHQIQAVPFNIETLNSEPEKAAAAVPGSSAQPVVVLVSGPLPDSAPQTIAGRAWKWVSLVPLDEPPGEDDFPARMRNNIRVLHKALDSSR